MINNIRVENFKSLKNINIPMKKLNVLSGLNGMGKSSLIHVFLLLRQSYLQSQKKLNIKGWLVNLGKGQDVLYQFANEEVIRIGLSWNESKDAEYAFEYVAESSELALSESNLQELLLYYDMRNLQYISADRLGPTLMHDMSQDAVAEGYLGSVGQYASHYLSVNGNRLKVDSRRFHSKTTSPFLANQVNAWLGEVSPGVKINLSEVLGADKMLLNFEFELQTGRTQSFKPINVGFGISYALSIIVALLIAEKDQIVIIENPEAHIHPRGQAELGKLMALVSASGAQLIVETHSDHIINGIRVAVKEGSIPSADVQFPWFYKITTDSEQYTDIENIKVDKSGELSRYPEGFMEEWNNQLLKLV